MNNLFSRQSLEADVLAATLGKILIGRARTQVQSRSWPSRGSIGVIGGAGGAIASLCLLLAFASSAYSQAFSQAPSPVVTETIMTVHAVGTFEVRLEVQKPDNQEAESAGLGRMSIDKQFHGDLEAVSKGQMLSIVTEVKGSAGYVAIERVSGTMHGRSGTFVLQHSATMTRGEPQMSITVVPDSATGQLLGLAGQMTIRVEAGKHSYQFDGTLPEAAENPSH